MCVTGPLLVPWLSFHRNKRRNQARSKTSMMPSSTTSLFSLSAINSIQLMLLLAPELVELPVFALGRGSSRPRPKTSAAGECASSSSARSMVESWRRRLPYVIAEEMLGEMGVLGGICGRMWRGREKVEEGEERRDEGDVVGVAAVVVLWLRDLVGRGRWMGWKRVCSERRMRVEV